MSNLVILQNDLRLHDNPALYYAAQEDLPIIVVYVIEKRIGTAALWWLTKSLTNFRERLQEYGIELLSVFDRNQFPDLIDYLQKDLSIEIKKIFSNGIDFDLPDKSLEKIHESLMPNNIYDFSKLPKEHKVFTPFWKFLQEKFEPELPVDDPKFSKSNKTMIQFDRFQEIPYEKTREDLDSHWKTGEKAALEQYRNFVKSRLVNYDVERDYFSRDGTSKLSPHLRFGEISARKIYHDLKKNSRNKRFLSELGWREFGYQTYYFHPKMDSIPLNPKYANFFPKYNEDHLIAWKNGTTGYPVIDAAMRQLKHTGWMHNRLRMVVASFLTKNLLIPWQQGEQFFYDCLIDGDRALNPMNWQWVAGCGFDSVPYFRIFNPSLQGEKFDSDGTFVRYWVEELKNVSKSFNIYKDYEKIPSKSYPKPIINYSKSRIRALETLKNVVNPKVVKVQKRSHKEEDSDED
ncbi:deoxyribodipyrimidine photo-lyase-like protein [Sarcoptes scabiei]|uniref:Deoxyribodipyrimidine photo-lyase-like protein n=1 Tax=Sarcoptes scabiei TaxID=52283 RepID=A0A132A2J5_SARSC|nr:deoxyribodipyrimidine photo-lyase-like protein [Sarcoptes scabiei]